MVYPRFQKRESDFQLRKTKEVTDGCCERGQEVSWMMQRMGLDGGR